MIYICENLIVLLSKRCRQCPIIQQTIQSCKKIKNNKTYFLSQRDMPFNLEFYPVSKYDKNFETEVIPILKIVPTLKFQMITRHCLWLPWKLDKYETIAHNWLLPIEHSAICCANSDVHLWVPHLLHSSSTIFPWRDIYSHRAWVRKNNQTTQTNITTFIYF